ncbi:MAG: type II toxin-antitoxin system ParD family antitoxin [Candidatus Solibacter sp.]
MPTRNVNLTDHFDRFIDDGVASGRFGNASEVVREGLRLLEQRQKEDQAKVEWLRAAIQEGIDASERGDSIQINSEEEMDAFFEDIHKEVRAEIAAERKRA